MKQLLIAVALLVACKGGDRSDRVAKQEPRADPDAERRAGAASVLNGSLSRTKTMSSVRVEVDGDGNTNISVEMPDCQEQTLRQMQMVFGTETLQKLGFKTLSCKGSYSSITII